MGSLPALAAADAPSPCDPSLFSCSTENNGSSIELGGFRPGMSPGSGVGGPPDADAGPAAPGVEVPVVGGLGPGRVVPSLCTTTADTFPQGVPYTGGCTPAAPATPGAPVIPYPTLADLASFAPAAPSLESEPAGAGIMGRPMNFLSETETHTLTGDLFGYPVSVRFTPARYTFTFDDGTTLTTTDASYSWRDHNLPQFTPTNSSHVFTTKGQHTVTATAEYTAEVNFTGTTTWLPVTGIVRATTSPYGLIIYRATTALVDKDCIQDPTGTGCPTPTH